MWEFISSFTFLFIVVLIWSISTWRKFKISEELKQLVTWCVHPDDITRYNIPLWAHIKDAQLHCNILEKHKISWDVEKDYVNDIIAAFQHDLIERFFSNGISHKKINELILPKSTAKYTDFFLFRLFCFLSEHGYDSRVLGHDVFEKQISYKGYGIWGKPLYDAVYELSEFGRTVQKLYYITYLSCKESLIYKNEIAGWITPEYFTDDLDKNQIHISEI